MKLKLKDESETQVLNKAQFHARALRAIGQDLSRLFPQTLEITLRAMNFQVIGRYLPRDPGGKGAQGSSQLLDKPRSKLLRDQPTVPTAENSTAPISFDRTYAPVDIDRMDESGANRRNEIDKVPDIYSLGEMLRMVGRIVDSDGRRLLNLSKDTYGVTFEYEDGAGQTQQREFSNLQLYSCNSSITLNEVPTCRSITGKAPFERQNGLRSLLWNLPRLIYALLDQKSRFIPRHLSALSYAPITKGK